MIDAHQHFWRLERGDYPWPNASVAPIFRDFGPEDLAPLLKRAGVERTILVQATDSLAETEFLLQFAAESPTVAGVVGWVDLAAPEAMAQIDKLRRDPLLKGLRPMLQSIAQTDWILRPEVQPALAHMAAVGLRFDALIQPRHLAPLKIMAQAHPDLRIVVDHLAKPRMGGGLIPDPEWTAGMRALAERPNLWCKLSGMLTEIGPAWRRADLEPFVGVAMEAFGPERVLWGSDWPVVNLAGAYQTWVETAQALTAHLDAAAQARIFAGSARAFYGLQP